MKTVSVIMGLALLTQPVLAQDEKDDKVETILSGEITSGGYGGVFVQVGPINQTTGLFVGGQGAWIINHKVAIGGRGYGLASDVKAGLLPKQDLNLEFGCGGLLVEYIVASDKLLHLTFHTMIGAGGVSMSRRYYDKDPFDSGYGGDAFFVLEPGVDGVLNLSRRVRLGLGATYRYLADVRYYGLDNSDLGGVSGRFIIMFGVF